MNKKFFKLFNFLLIITFIIGNRNLVLALSCTTECERGFYLQYNRNPDPNNINDKIIMQNCIDDCLKNSEGLGEETEKEGENTNKGLIIENPLSPVSDIWQLIMRLINIAQNIGVFVCIILIVWAGYLYITSVGNEAKIKQAQKTLIWALVGFGIIIIAGAIPPLIYEFITGKSWESLYNQESNSVNYTENLEGENYPTSQPSGGMVYNTSNGECI